MLLQGVVSRHDRERFEIVGFSIGKSDGSNFDDEYRATFDTFRDVPANDPAAAAKIIYDDKIDILLDVTGHTLENCQEILAHRPAPAQAQIIGYGNTTGAPYIDYFVTDKTWMRPEYEAITTETITYLPDTWFSGYRAEAGLPRDGFVFCNFNQSFKFEPTIFSVWMRLLEHVPASVLWLGHWERGALANLQREAEARGIEGSRLVTAGIVPHAEHLARLKLADLMLDTRVFGGGATTVDALWAGVPIVTCPDEFPNSANGATLSKALGVPEMVTNSMAEYQDLALALATDPARYNALRAKVDANRLTHPLFDEDRFARHFDRAIELIWQSTVSGDKSPISVPAENQEFVQK